MRSDSAVKLSAPMRTPRSKPLKSVTSTPAKTVDTVQITMRVERAMVERAEEMARLLCRPGERLTKNDAMRMAFERGFDAFLADADAEAK